MDHASTESESPHVFTAPMIVQAERKKLLTLFRAANVSRYSGIKLQEAIQTISPKLNGEMVGLQGDNTYTIEMSDAIAWSHNLTPSLREHLSNQYISATLTGST